VRDEIYEAFENIYPVLTEFRKIQQWYVPSTYSDLSLDPHVVNPIVQIITNSERWNRERHIWNGVSEHVKYYFTFAWAYYKQIWKVFLLNTKISNYHLTFLVLGEILYMIQNFQFFFIEIISRCTCINY
jgi:hypothetical protein